MWVPNFCDKKISGSSLIYTKKSDPLQANMIDHHSSSSMIHKNNLKQTIESRLSWRTRYILGTYCHLYISWIYTTHKQTFVWFENNMKIILVMPFLSEKKQHLNLFPIPLSSSFFLNSQWNSYKFYFFFKSSNLKQDKTRITKYIK